MNEVGRLFKKIKIVVSSRGMGGLVDAGKGYLYKNFPILSVGVKKTGDILIVGDFNFGELVDVGYVCKQISIGEFDEKYIDLYDIFCFGNEILNQVQDDKFELIKKYNKLIVNKKVLGEKSILYYIKKNKNKKIVYASSSTNISGGVMVIAQHLQQLQNLGFNVVLISQDINIDMSWKKNFNIPILHTEEVNCGVKGCDIVVATFWNTVYFVQKLNANEKYYLVQNKEHLFYDENNPFYKKAKKTYEYNDLKFLTVSKWCQEWLKDEFNKNAQYIPNCIDTKLFNVDDSDCFDCDNKYSKFCNNEKRRILIEGNPESEYKNVDESFEIVNKLDKKKFEVWLVSYGGRPKKWYKYDRLFQKVPYHEMPIIYRSCDILLKTSKLESFSYPPLEMMACGGLCVVAENEGNSEYIKNGYNALTYEVGDIDQAIENINNIVNDAKLREKLREGGFDTVQFRSFKKLSEKLKSIF